MKPLLIAGGDGFIGKHLVQKLIDLEIPVLVIDNHITSTPNKINNPLFSRISLDVCEIEKEIIPSTSGIIHLASIAAPIQYKKNPELVIEANTIGTKNLIEIAKRDKVRILFASTSEVYGDLFLLHNRNRGIKEGDDAYIKLLTKRSCYGTAKRLGEEFIQNYINQGGDGSNLRFFNIYGPGMDTKLSGYGRVIPNFINKGKNNQPLTIFGDGEQIRSFLWIDEAIDAIIKLFFFKNKLPSAINIGNEWPISIKELAKKISKLYGVSLEIDYREKDIDDPLWRKPDISLIRKLIGWEPLITIDEGLRRLTS